MEREAPALTEERQRVEAAQKDPARFAELYEEHFDRVYAFVAGRVRNRIEAQDLTSEVFHHALANLTDDDADAEIEAATESALRDPERIAAAIEVHAIPAALPVEALNAALLPRRETPGVGELYRRAHRLDPMQAPAPSCAMIEPPLPAVRGEGPRSGGEGLPSSGRRPPSPRARGEGPRWRGSAIRYIYVPFDDGRKGNPPPACLVD